jgi:Flp pilus assembly protein TadG
MRERALHWSIRAGARRGQALVEFAMTSIIVLMLIYAVVEFGRIILVYTTIADAARIGTRYAVTNSSVPGSAPLTKAYISSQVTAVVNSFLGPATVNVNTAVTTTNFPNNNLTTAGNPVAVTVSYPYDLLISYYPINITLSSTSEGIITW